MSRHLCDALSASSSEALKPQSCEATTILFGPEEDFCGIGRALRREKGESPLLPPQL